MSALSMPIGAVPLPDDLGTCARMTGFWARHTPDEPAIICTDRVVSFAELDKRTNKLANALRSLFAPGSHVGILSRNSDMYIALLLATAKAGMVAVVLNWRLVPRELAQIAQDAGLASLFHESEFAKAVDAIAAGVEGVVSISLGSAALPDAGLLALIAGESDVPPPESTPDQMSLLLYTSGTTGQPKGVMQNQCGMLRVVTQSGAVGPRGSCRPDDVSLLTTPLFHVAGIGWAMTSLGCGGMLVIPPIVEMAEIAGLIATHRITRATILPAMMPSLLAAAENGADLSNLRLIAYGASVIPEPLLKRMIDELDCSFLQNYGMSEITGSATYLAPEQHYPGSARMLSCGCACPGVRVRIDAPDDHGVGEVLIEHPSLMLGYWNQPERTAEVIRDGWYMSGDMGLIDEDGFLFLKDRKKDMIISGGENIYPAEVESALSEHPAIAKIAVIGVPSAKWGEEPKAFVVLRDGLALSADELIAFARERIAGYKIPRSIEVVETLPLTSVGKIAKEELRAHYWGGRQRRIN